MAVTMILYQILMAAALPFMTLHALWRGGWGEVRARLALGLGRAPSGPRLWLHGASVGELTSARWLVLALINARPDLTILVTANSRTGRDMVAAWGIAGVQGRLAPFDSAGAAGRMLDAWQPQALVIVENELWPQRIAAAHRRGTQVLVIGARLSARSAARWARSGGLIMAMLRQIDFLSPQDEASASRFTALGLPGAALGPVVTLKAQAARRDLPPPFAAPAPRSAVLLAASTHDDEEAGILQGFAVARAGGGPQLLILAPRHPERGDAVAALIAAAGLPFARRSLGQVPGAQVAVFLADTLGEMDLWYAMAGICLIGGSFARRGGHTPFEPAQYGCAILHGPSVHNFAPQYSALDAGGGAILVQAPQMLAQSLIPLDAAQQTALGQRAQACLAPFAQGTAQITARILADLPRAQA